MKKIIKYFSLILVFLISIYFTNNSINTYKDEDSIMKKIKNNKNFLIEPVNAIIKDNTIIPGIEGKDIDYDKSYSQMKKYGSYNESLIRLKKISPTTSMSNYYDLYIEGGNPSKRMVSLVFIIEKSFPSEIMTILNNKNIQATFFIDGTLLENNVKNIKENDYEYELLSYDSKYNSAFMKTSISYLENITKEKVKYCYTPLENDELLKFCIKNKLHTIKPKYIWSNNIYHNIKKYLDKASIYVIEDNSYNRKELPVVIDYIYSKGYEIVTLNRLLSEELE